MLLVHEAVVVPAPPERVWSLVIHPAGWWPYLELDAVPGGRFEERWQEIVTSGDVLDVDPPRLLRLSWKDEGWPAATEVELRLEPAAEGTLVTVRHTGWAALPDAETLVAGHRAGWRMHLEDLRRVASEG